MTTTSKTSRTRGSKDAAPPVLREHIEIEIVRDRRSPDGVARLSRELNEACTAAVTPHQIAALLEAEGLNDRLVEERYGRPGVFALAKELYERVPLRRDPLDAAPTMEELIPPAPASTLALLMRGPIYLAPLVFFLAAGSSLEGQQLLVAGLVALLLAWSWNQGFGALTHRLLGRGDVIGAHRMARTTMFVGIVLVTAASGIVATIAFGPDRETFLFAAGQSAYLMGTATLLVFGRDRLLIIALAPGVALATASLSSTAIPASVVLVAAAGTPVLVVVAAIVATHDVRKEPLPKLTPRDRHQTVAYSTLGLIWALVIGMAAIAAADSESILTTVSIAASGMVLTMGVAEWQLLKVREESRLMMLLTGDPTAFASWARITFMRAVAIIAMSLIVSTLVVAGVAASFDALTDVSVVLAIGFGFLGLAFFAGLSLVSMGKMTLPIVGSLALILEVGALLAVTSLGSVPSAAIYGAGCAVLCVILIVAAMVEVGDPVAHR